MIFLDSNALVSLASQNAAISEVSVTWGGMQWV